MGSMGLAYADDGVPPSANTDAEANTPAAPTTIAPSEPTPTVSSAPSSADPNVTTKPLVQPRTLTPLTTKDSTPTLVASPQVAGTFNLAWTGKAGPVVGSSYVFSGTGTPGAPVVIWWDLDGGSNWRKFATGDAIAADGTYKVVVRAGSAGSFKFTATGGHQPGTDDTGSWGTRALSVRIYNAATPTFNTAYTGKAGPVVGATYVFSGTGTPGAPVVVWWKSTGGWNAFSKRGTIASTGKYSISIPITSAGSFQFTATGGHKPGTDGTASWGTRAVSLRTYKPVTPSFNVGFGTGGAVVGSTYVFSGTGNPGAPVVVWWRTTGAWKPFSQRGTIGTDGRYRVSIPIGSASTFQFTATGGHTPGTNGAGSWGTRAVTVKVAPKSTFRLDKRCTTGRAICISKNQRKLAWVVNGQIQMTMDVRFGSELTPTREGSFKVNWKSRNHVSSLYHTPMPYALFFSGGQAVHYSADFAARGYNGASHGCVNVRDKVKVAKLFDLARVGDKVIVYK